MCIIKVVLQHWDVVSKGFLLDWVKKDDILLYFLYYLIISIYNIYVKYIKKNLLNWLYHSLRKKVKTKLSHSPMKCMLSWLVMLNMNVRLSSPIRNWNLGAKKFSC